MQEPVTKFSPLVVASHVRQLLEPGPEHVRHKLLQETHWTKLLKNLKI